MNVTTAQGNLVGIKTNGDKKIKRIGTSDIIKVSINQAEQLSNCWFTWIKKDEDGNDKAMLVPMNDVIKYGKKEEGNYCYEI